MPVSRRVFVSYARSDSRYTRALADQLRSTGNDVWMDTEEIPGGVGFQERLAAGIDHCDAVIAVLSKAFGESKWVRNELHYASDEGKPIIPVQRTGTNLPPWFELQFGSLQRLTIPDPKHRGVPAALQLALDGQGGGVTPRRRWPIASVVVAGVVLLVGVAWLLLRPDTSPKWGMQNIEFVFDRSGNARDTYQTPRGPVEKSVAARDALADKIDLDRGTSMALREFGDDGECAPSDLRVGFRVDNGERIIDAVDDSGAAGPADLYRSVIAATNDFGGFDPELDRAGAIRKIVVFVAGEDGCPGTADELRRELAEAAGLQLEIRLVGLDLPATVAAELDDTFQDICDVNCNALVRNATTPDELDDIINEEVIVDPVIQDFESINEVMSEIGTAQNEAADAADAFDIELYRRELDEFQSVLDGSDPTFEDVIGRLEAEGGFDDVTATAARLRDQSRQLLNEFRSRTEIVEERGADPEDENLIEEWNQQVEHTNALIDDKNETADELLALEGDVLQRLRDS